MEFLNDTSLYVDLIIPVTLQKLYTYKVPESMTGSVAVGKRVVVQFGKSKMYTALIYSVHHNKPLQYEAKELLELLDKEPVVIPLQFKLWEWMSEYYLCTLGEIMAAALPTVLKLQSETKVILNPFHETENEIITGKEQLIIDTIREKSSITINDAVKLAGKENGMRLIHDMIDKDILLLHEELKETYRPKRTAYVKFSQKASDEEFLQEVFQKIEKRAPKQLNLLMGFMKIKSEKEKDALPRDILLQATGSTAQVLKELVKKEVLEVFEDDGDLGAANVHPTGREMKLTDVQQQAYENIGSSFENNKVVLLHGVTSSGKTEVYIRLISDMIDQGKQVLYLLPEIALTTQIISRLKSHFGDRLLVYHSRFGSQQRADIYTKMLADGSESGYRYPIVVGARSAVFLPLKNPGLIIVDEEHDGSYKQNDPAPRYHARDTSVLLGKISGASVVLGSATPSLESYYNSESGKFDRVEMNVRYGGLRMPEIKILDLKEAYRKKQMKSHFSSELLDAIGKSLASRNQVILFQNRRGFAPVLECKNCGWIPHCVNCDVTLTYHKRSNHLRCHYCGYTTFPPSKCLACGDHDIRMKGTGTERIEDEISIFFSDSKVERLDLDTGSSKSSYLRILNGFESGEIDILVGTQMVTKGLDFDNVSLVGVINADHLINFPDFRSVERSYQLLAQVAGRSGRKFRRGSVLIQSFNINHPLLNFLVNNDYKGFYRYEVTERQKFLYPPFYRLILLKLKNRNEKKLDALSETFAAELRNVFGTRVLGPVAPPVSRIRNYYLKNILLKLEKTLSNKEVKHKLTEVADRFLYKVENRSLIIQVDVDPV